MAYSERELYILSALAVHIGGMSEQQAHGWAATVLSDAPEAPQEAQDAPSIVGRVLVAPEPFGSSSEAQNVSSFSVAEVLEAHGYPVNEVVNYFGALLAEMQTPKRQRIINSFLHNRIYPGSAEELSDTLNDDVQSGWTVLTIEKGGPRCDFDERPARYEKDGAFYCKHHHSEKIEQDRRA